MHLGGWLTTQEAGVALGYRLVRLLRLLSCLATSRVHPNLSSARYGVYRLLSNNNQYQQDNRRKSNTICDGHC